MTTSRTTANITVFRRRPSRRPSAELLLGGESPPGPAEVCPPYDTFGRGGRGSHRTIRSLREADVAKRGEHVLRSGCAPACCGGRRQVNLRLILELLRQVPYLVRGTSREPSDGDEILPAASHFDHSRMVAAAGLFGAREGTSIVRPSAALISSRRPQAGSCGPPVRRSGTPLPAA